MRNRTMSEQEEWPQFSDGPSEVRRYRWRNRGVWSEWTREATPPEGATYGQMEVTTSDGFHSLTDFEFIRKEGR